MKKRWMSLLLTLSMIVAMMVGCGESPGNKQGGDVQGVENEGAGTEDVAYEDLPTLNVLFIHGYTYEGDDNVIWKELAMRVGAKIHFIGADTDKYNTMLASGEGYDIIMSVGRKMKDISTGGSLLPMDALLSEYGSNIQENAPLAIEYSKENLSDDTNSLYWVPYDTQYTGKSVGSREERLGLIRWDYYKEMGYPEVNSIDEYLLMIKDMHELHPTTESGGAIYGMAIPSDKLQMTMNSPFENWLGMTAFGTTGCYRWEDMSYVNKYDDDGSFWAGIDFYHKANELGLLDPDSFTLTEEDLKAKATEGKLLTITAQWQVNQMEQGQGFMAIPKTWAYPTSVSVSNVTRGIGIPTGGFAINKKSEHPELCMKFLDFVFSEEGANLIYNGIEGTHYIVENGVRSLTQEALDMYNETEGARWEETGLYTAESSHFCGLSRTAIAPDGKALNLVMDPSMYESTLTDVEKDYCDYYGVSYPQEIVTQYVEKYDLIDASTADPYVIAFLPVPTDEIMQLEVALDEEADSLIADLVLASEEEYEAKVAEAKSRLEKIGLQKVNDYYEGLWQEAFDKADEYR